MDEKLMQFLQEQFDKIDKRFDEMDKRLDKFEGKLIEYDVHLLKSKEQTMSDSEMARIIRSHEKRISDLETEVRIIKKAIRNMG